MKKSNTLKKYVALALAFAFMLTLLTPAIAQAATKIPALNATEKTIVIGKTFDFNIVNQIKGSKYEWSSNNEKVALVNKDGLVTGVNKGTAKITCKITAGAKKYRSIAVVTVLKPAVKVMITNKVKTLEVGSYYKLKTSLTPASSNDIVSWSSSDTEIADIENDGSFVVDQAGTVTLTGTTVSGRTDSVTIQMLNKGEVAADTEEEADNNDDAAVEEPKDEVKVLKEVLNNDFATSTGSFVGRGSAALSQSSAGVAAEGGKGYLKVAGRTATWNGAATDLTALVIPGASYKVTGWVRYTAGADVEKFKITQERTSRDDNKWIGVTNSVDVEKGKWVKLEGTLEVSPSTTQCIIYFETESMIDFFVDNVVISQLDTEIKKDVKVEVEKAKVGDVVYKNDFEDGRVVDARGSSERTIVTSVTHGGKSSLQVKRTAGWDGAGIKFGKDNNITLESLYGKTVHASFYIMYNEGADEVAFKLNNRMEKADNTDNILAMPTVKKGEWTLIEADCVIADGALSDMIFIETDNKDALTYYIDDVEIKVVK